MLLGGERIAFDGHVPEEAQNEPGQPRITQAWRLELGLRRNFGKHHPVQAGRIEIKHAPAPDAAAGRNAIVHLAWVNGDDVACRRLNRPDAAPRRLRSRKQDADAVLIVAMAGKGAAGLELDCIDPRNCRPVLRYAMGGCGQLPASRCGQSGWGGKQDHAARQCRVLPAQPAFL